MARERRQVIIGGVPVGAGSPTYIIAEVGSNHDGSLDRALKLIQTAADCGADCAKFQLFRGDKLYPGTFTPGAVKDEWLPELKAACHEAGVEFMCSVFCQETLDAYMAVSPAAIKIASPEATDRDLIGAALGTGLPVLISTGAMSHAATTGLRDWLFGSTRDWALLHCVSDYPAKLAELNLLSLLSFYWGQPFGFSDHSESSISPVVAVALGASIIEKHLTDDRTRDGADHAFAIEPDDFAAMVDAIRDAETMLGDGRKRVMASEDPTDRRQAA